jgi:hypothetical protein
MKKVSQFPDNYPFCIKAISERQKEELEYKLWVTGNASSIQIDKQYIFVKIKNNRYNVFTTSEQNRDLALHIIWNN